MLTCDLRVVLSAADSTLQVCLLDRPLPIILLFKTLRGDLQVDLDALVVVAERAVKDDLELGHDLLLDRLLVSLPLSHSISSVSS